MDPIPVGGGGKRKVSLEVMVANCANVPMFPRLLRSVTSCRCVPPPHKVHVLLTGFMPPDHGHELHCQ